MSGAAATQPAHAATAAAAPAHGGVGPRPTDHAAAQPSPTAHGTSPSTHGTAIVQDRATLPRLTTATGYVATGLLALTLVTGPVNLLLRRRAPISSYFRRDVGMWTAAFSIVHVIFGLQVHAGGQLSGIVRYFVAGDGSPLVSSFGLGNWTGLAATVIVVGLLAISSDLALRTLKSSTWKWLQRLNYALFALVLAHAIFYGALLRATSPFTLLLIVSVILVLVGQLTGIWLWRRRRSRTTTLPA